MNKKTFPESCVGLGALSTFAAGSILLSLVAATPAQAMQIATSNPDLSIRWDNTLKYSNAWRLKKQSDELISQPNSDDGARNFSRGLISNRFDLLSEVDLFYKNYGLRVSGAAWYDSVYNSSNDNSSQATVSHFGRANRFSSETRKLHGRDAELLDLFVSGTWDIGDSTVTGRLGRHALLWGESLFQGANGIAGAMAPVDVYKLTSVPSTPFREAIRPVNQVSGLYQINDMVSLAAFYQFEWEENRLPGSGSYFSTTDVLGEGTDFIIAGPNKFLRGKDLDAKDSGQGGVSVRFRLPNSQVDYGLYAIRFHSKGPQTVVRPAGGPPVNGVLGTYDLVYHEDIKLYGASAAMTILDASVGFEVSTRRDTNLVSQTDTAILGASNSDIRNNPPYPVGNTAHAQMSWLYSAGPNWLSREASFVGEVAWNRVLSVTKNREQLDPTTTRDAWGLRVGYTPRYRQVRPGLDIGIPMSVGYNPKGRSGAVASFNGGVDRGGNFSVGIDGTYMGDWNFSLLYTGYFGSESHGTEIVDGQQSFSFKQNLRDRDFVAFSLSRTF